MQMVKVQIPDRDEGAKAFAASPLPQCFVCFNDSPGGSAPAS